MMVKEKRRFLRIPFSAAVKIKMAGALAVFGNLSKDISVGGIKFVSGRFLPIGSIIRIEIKLIKESFIMKFAGRIVWVKSLYDDELYEVGVRIFQIAEGDVRKLKDCVAANKPR